MTRNSRSRRGSAMIAALMVIGVITLLTAMFLRSRALPGDIARPQARGVVQEMRDASGLRAANYASSGGLTPRWVREEMAADGISFEGGMRNAAFSDPHRRTLQVAQRPVDWRGGAGVLYNPYLLRYPQQGSNVDSAGLILVAPSYDPLTGVISATPFAPPPAVDTSTVDTGGLDPGTPTFGDRIQ